MPNRARSSGKPADFSIASSDPLHVGFGRIKSGESLTRVAKSLRISPERLRRYVGENAEFRRQGRRWAIVQDRRLFQLPLYTNGRMRRVIVDADGAAELGRFMSAVGRFLSTNKVSLLEPFQGGGVVNAYGQVLPFETDPNALYALDAKGELSFHQIYQIKL